MKNKPHVIEEYHYMPPFTCEVYIDKPNCLCLVILNIAAWDAFFPVWIFASIFEEAIEISSCNDNPFEPPFSFLGKVKGFNNGVFRNLQGKAINCCFLSIKIVIKFLSYS